MPPPKENHAGRRPGIAAAMLRLFLLPALAFWMTSGCTVDLAADLTPAPYRPPVTSGEIANPDLAEASGMAASIRRPGCFWMVNDSGNGAVLHAVGPAGQHFGSVALAGAVNTDWEDLASFTLDGQAYLLIADTGDNRAARGTIALYLVKEPDIPGSAEHPPLQAIPARVIRFRFPDGPKDCEAVAVDPADALVLLFSKRLRPPMLYSLELRSTASADVTTARALGPVDTIPSPTEAELMADPIYGRFRSQPTSLDISADGNRAAVLTYGGAYLFSRVYGEPWEQVFAREPAALPGFKLRQAESLCFGTDGRTIFISSERQPAPLLRLEPSDGINP